MARRKQATKEAHQGHSEVPVVNEGTAKIDITLEKGNPAQQAVASNPEGTTPQQPAPDARKSIVTPDPRPVMSISLGDSQGRVQLRRSHKYKQMQIQFDRQPDEKFLLILKRAGWTDRTESEGIWTKQIDPDARWQSVEKMEIEFKTVANAIRRDKGLAPAMMAITVA